MQPNVFIVAEEPVDLPIAQDILVAAGYAVEAFEHSDALLPRIEACTCGCVVIDSNLPGVSGLELQSKLIDHGVELPVLFIGANADVTTAVTAMKKGALDFLTKPLDPNGLLAAVELAVRTAEQAAAKRAVLEDARKRWASLSRCERKVCRLSAAGLLNKQLAAELGITLSTAHAQRTSGMKKLGIDNIVSLARLLDLIGDAD